MKPTFLNCSKPLLTLLFSGKNPNEIRERVQYEGNFNRFRKTPALAGGAGSVHVLPVQECETAQDILYRRENAGKIVLQIS